METAGDAAGLILAFNDALMIITTAAQYRGLVALHHLTESLAATL